METPNKQQQSKFSLWLRNSITARMLIVGFLIIVLLIPLFFIQDLIRERSYLQHEVIDEINQQWGNEVLLYGPILKVPYKTYSETLVTDEKTKRVYTETNEKINYAFFFPEALNINSGINPEEKKRGIYTTAVYNSEIVLNGQFSRPNFKDIDLNDKDIIWDKAKLIIQSSNVKGVNQATLTLNQTEYELTARYVSKNSYTQNAAAETAYDMSYSYNQQSLHTLETKSIKPEQVKFDIPLNFNIKFNIKGSKQIRFIPVGKETQAQITSNWKTANFFGEFLPYNDNKITENGFDAKWKILDINRPFSQEYFNQLPKLDDFAFGVNFMIPVNEYLKSERSSKYGFLVIALTFLIFFLLQTLSKIYIHPFQYLMIGLALTMFYTLLISITEHSTFLKAYLIAGSSVVILITLYSKTILKTFKFPIFIGLALTALYTFIYVIIQLESYALLTGSIGLFLILAIVMFVSRKIDWNNE
ncbi:MAG: cell envelope integrity protein CreD [Aestuariibaculum sp.]